MKFLFWHSEGVYASLRRRIFLGEEGLSKDHSIHVARRQCHDFISWLFPLLSIDSGIMLFTEGLPYLT
jgi:hypothetical protein